MGSVHRLRQFFGHVPLLLVGVALLTLDAQKRVLLLQRIDNSCWGPPRKALEPGEIVVAADLPVNSNPPARPVIGTFVKFLQR